MEEPRTTVDYNGRTYPFYKTNRGNVDFENAGHTMDDVLAGKSLAALALVYFHLVDCARRAGTPIDDTFDQFINNSEADVTDVFQRLSEVKKKLTDKKTKPNPEPEPAKS